MYSLSFSLPLLVLTYCLILTSNLSLAHSLPSSKSLSRIHTESVDLNQNCSGKFDCSDHAFCDQKAHKCKCQFGFQEVPGTNTCELYKCHKTAECLKLFGPGTRCNGLNYCDCDSSYDLNPENQTCITLKHPVGGDCVDRLDCGTNVECVDKKCHCHFGFLPSETSVNCEQYRCIDSHDCTSFHPHTVCDHESLCLCDSAHEWILQPNVQNCTSRYIPLGEKCENDQQCGGHAVCGNGTCLCSLGFKPEAVGDQNCVAVDCSNDHFCQGMFDQHAVCADIKVCACDSDNSWILNHDTQKCTNRKQFINTTCQHDEDCGKGAFCEATKTVKSCQCQFAKLVTSNGQDCVSYHCKGSDEECKKAVDEHSRCTGSLCECETGYKLEESTQVCAYKGEEPNYPINDIVKAGNLPWFIVALVVILFITYHWIYPFCRKKCSSYKSQK